MLPALLGLLLCSTLALASHVRAGPAYTALAQLNPADSVLVEGHAFVFGGGDIPGVPVNVESATVTMLEDPTLQLTTDSNGYFSFQASVGENITLVMEKWDYTTTQGPTVLVPPEGLQGEQAEYTFQATLFWEYDLLTLILPEKTDPTMCHFCVTVCAYNKTLRDDPQGEPNVTVSIFPPVDGPGGVPFYFGVFPNNLTNPFQRGLNVTSLDGGVLFFNVPVSDTPYTISAYKEGEVLSETVLTCNTPDRFINGAPPHSPRVIYPVPTRQVTLKQRDELPQDADSLWMDPESAE